MSDKVIDFAIVGKPKCGTTALARFLSDHSELCVSKPKEPNFFATDHIKESDDYHGKKKYFPIRTWGEYQKCFSHCRSDQMRGEASPRYLNSKEAAKNIYEQNPETKIIIMIRNPIDFMYSAHKQLVNACIEDEEDFGKAIKLEGERKKGNKIPSGARYPSHFLYTERAKFYKEIKRYIDVFPRENIFIMTLEEFNKDNRVKYKEVLNFLGVNTNFEPDFTQINSSKIPRFKLLNRVFNSATIRKLMFKAFGPRLYSAISNTGRSMLLKDQQRKPMDSRLKNRLEQLVVRDVEKLSKLLDRNLTKEWNLNNDFEVKKND